MRRRHVLASLSDAVTSSLSLAALQRSIHLTNVYAGLLYALERGSMEGSRRLTKDTHLTKDTPDRSL